MAVTCAGVFCRLSVCFSAVTTTSASASPSAGASAGAAGAAVAGKLRIVAMEAAQRQARFLWCTRNFPLNFRADYK
jgi:hypothetical protein